MSNSSSFSATGDSMILIPMIIKLTFWLGSTVWVHWETDTLICAKINFMRIEVKLNLLTEGG